VTGAAYDARPMRLLVLAPEPIGPDDVRGAMGAEIEGAEVRVVSPALNDSSVAFWVSDSDDAIAEAETAQRESVDRLRSEGIEATGDTGESEPLTALQDALATFAADRILVFINPDDAQAYKEEDVIGEAERRFGLPVTESPLPGR
jgi:hypothetical protein